MSGLFALRQVLVAHVLPQLSSMVKGRFACTCKDGRELILEIGLQGWQKIAQDILPPLHPVNMQGSQVT